MELVVAPEAAAQILVRKVRRILLTKTRHLLASSPPPAGASVR